MSQITRRLLNLFGDSGPEPGKNILYVAKSRVAVSSVSFGARFFLIKYFS